LEFLKEPVLLNVIIAFVWQPGGLFIIPFVTGLSPLSPFFS
jgi:hypothetical protein